MLLAIANSSTMSPNFPQEREVRKETKEARPKVKEKVKKKERVRKATKMAAKRVHQRQSQASHLLEAPHLQGMQTGCHVPHTPKTEFADAQIRRYHATSGTHPFAHLKEKGKANAGTETNAACSISKNHRMSKRKQL